MMPQPLRDRIVALLKREVVPAIGCTEPVAVALCAARAREILGEEPEQIDILLSANMLKNAMGVGIPGTGMIGLPIAIALGVLIGKSSYGLEVLRDTTPEAAERGRRYVARNAIRIALKEDTAEKLYIEAVCRSGLRRTTAVIAGSHTDFVYLADGDRVLLDRRGGRTASDRSQEVELTLERVWEFAHTAPLGEIAFIDEARRLNMAAAEASFRGEYGHSLGRALRGERELRLLGDSIFSRILAYTSGACDARMAGAQIPVMSNSGSGNQGIAATVPVVVYAEQTGASAEALTRALVLSHLTAVYIKQRLGRLSALCGCVVAATGSSCGITRLMGGGYTEITYAVKNMIANLTGMICDGAKPSCALKVSSGVSTAVMSAMLAMEHKCVTSVEGIIDDDVDRCIENLTTIGRDGMNETDRLVLSIMIGKHRAG